MVIVIMGGIELDEAEALVRKHFGDIPRRPEPAPIPTTIGGDVDATWDIDAEVVTLIFPGPYANYKERLMLAMFGSFLRGYIANSATMQGTAKGIYVSNQVYPVGDFPFFVYGEAQASVSQADLRNELVELTEASLGMFDEKIVERLKLNMKGFVESSMIKEANPYVPRQQYLGQEALNTGVKHIFLEGQSREEFFALVDTITLAEFQAVLNKYVNRDNMYKVSIRRR
jgi:predicted Zn-dependent peptidase